MKIHQQRMLDIVRNGHIMIDQEIHNWDFKHGGKPLKVTMYIRNNGKYKVAGNLVFSATSSKKGLEKQFLKEAVNIYGEAELRKYVKEKIDNGENGKYAATYNYIIRGKKLAQGEEYEPVKTKANEEDYTFKFREYVSIKPGEIIQLDHDQEIPLSEAGFLLNIKIDNIEF
jgi:hypothetical protein